MTTITMGSPTTGPSVQFELSEESKRAIQRLLTAHLGKEWK